jgi:hypothetical protein
MRANFDREARIFLCRNNGKRNITNFNRLCKKITQDIEQTNENEQ